MSKSNTARKPSKSGQDRHLPGDPKNGQKRQKCHISGFQERIFQERSGSRNEQVQSWDSKPETSEPLCGKVELGSTQLQTLRIACRATLRTSSSRGAKKGASWRCLLLESRRRDSSIQRLRFYKKNKTVIISKKIIVN